MSGRCVPPVNGSLTTKTSPGPGRARARRRPPRASRRGGRGCARPGRSSARPASKSAVEQSRRSLMLAEKAERMSAAPISSATARSALPRTWSSIFRRHALVRIRVLFPSLTPTHPGGSQQVAPSSSTTAGPVTASGSPGGKLELRARADLGGSHGDELDRRGRGRRSRTAPRARGGTPRRGRPRAAPSARRTGRGSAGRPRRGRQLAGLLERDRRTRRTRSRRSSLATRPSAERTPAAAGTSTLPIPSSSASAHACSGPAPPNATSAKSRGSWPRSTETSRSAREHLGVDDVDDAPGSKPPSARSAARAVELEPAGKRAGQPAEQRGSRR